MYLFFVKQIVKLKHFHGYKKFNKKVFLKTSKNNVKIIYYSNLHMISLTLHMKADFKRFVNS